MSTLPRFLLTTFAYRNRAALFALLPLLALALVAPVFWLYLSVHLSVGAIALFIPLALLVVPSFIGLGISLIVSVFTSLGALSYMLWRGRSLGRWFWGLPTAPIAIACITTWTFLRDELARRSSEGLDPEWSAVALLAQAAYPVVSLLMVAFILLPQRAPSKSGVWWRLLGVVLVWAVYWSALGPAQVWARDYVVRRSVRMVDEIPTDNRNPVVMAVCAGRLEDANTLILKNAHLGEGDLDSLISRCLKTNTSRFYAERVPTVLDAILALEKRRGMQFQKGCSDRQQALLHEIYQNDFPDVSLRAYLGRGLPLTCPADLGRSGWPIWWWMVYGQDLSIEQFQRLKSLGVDLAQKDTQGLDLLGANPNDAVSNLDAATLQWLNERGLKAQAGAMDSGTSLKVSKP